MHRDLDTVRRFELIHVTNAKRKNACENSHSKLTNQTRFPSFFPSV